MRYVIMTMQFLFIVLMFLAGVGGVYNNIYGICAFAAGILVLILFQLWYMATVIGNYIINNTEDEVVPTRFPLAERSVQRRPYE